MSPTHLLTHAIKDVTVVTFAGAHVRDQPQIDQIGRHVYDLVDNRNAGKLILDFAKVQTFSSQALGVLIALDKKLAEKRGKLVLCGVRPEIVRLFEIARLHKHFKFAPDEQSALAVFGLTSAG